MYKFVIEAHQRVYGQGKSLGGVALEYILVSVFGLMLAIAAVGFVMSTLEDKLQGLEQRLGIEFDFDSLDIFRGEGGLSESSSSLS